jgi:prevent-host-death family protein
MCQDSSPPQWHDQTLSEEFNAMETMSFTRTISATDFRHRLKEALDELDRSGASLVVTRRGEPRFIVLTLESYEDLIDARLVASPRLQQRLSEARAHYEAGEGGSYEALRQELLEEGHSADAD